MLYSRFAFGDSYTNLMGPAGSVWTWNDFKSGKDSTLNGVIQPNGVYIHFITSHRKYDIFGYSREQRKKEI